MRPLRFLLCLLVATAPAVGQPVPADLDIVATAGGAFPDGPASATVTVRIGADGAAFVARYRSGFDAAPDVEPMPFTVAAADLEQLWQTITSNDFFGLQERYENSSVRDRSVARLRIFANGATHAVTTRNVAVEAFDTILTAINALTPGNDDLVYDVSVPVTSIPTPVCEQPGKRQGGALPSKLSLQSALGPAELSAGPIDTPSPAPADATAGHPGTVVAYGMPLAEAVRRDAATLSAKGEYFGDGITIEGDNTGSLTTDDLDVTLYLELWGEAASAEMAARVANAIEEAWTGTTSDGKSVTVNVVTRLRPGGFSPPGTPGYHQVQLIPDSTYKSHVFDFENPFGVNEGVGGGAWSTEGTRLEELWAHEAGHLLGFEDRYHEYEKQEDGKWKRTEDGKPFTDEQLGDEVQKRRPDLPREEIMKVIQKPGNERVTVAKEGFEDDLMGTLKGQVQQSDLDTLASQAGLLIEVRPGDALLNKWGSRQGMAVIRTEDLFVPKGGTARLDGLYAACLDRARGAPDPGDGFDVAPSLADWVGIDAASAALTLLRYLDENDLFCPGDAFAQSALWRLTNNAGMNDVNVAAYLADVGIDVGYREFDFPRLTNPNFAVPHSTVLTPPELFVPAVASSAGLLPAVMEPVSFSASLSAPRPGELAPVYSWSLDSPETSAAALSTTEGTTTTLIPDVRGFYEVTLRAELADSLTGADDPPNGTFTRRTTLKIAAVDSLVESFESGTLQTDGPFLWRTGGGLGTPWLVTDELSHTGAYSVRSAPIGDGMSTTLRARFEQRSDGPLSFSYRLLSHFTDSLLFSVDEVVLGRWGGSTPWTTVTIDLPAGSHTANWIYQKDAADALGADRVWLDDVFFPESAVFTGVDEAEVAFGEPGGVRLGLTSIYPNPFAEATTILYEIPRGQDAELVAYDVLGRPVAVLASGFHATGTYRVRFEAAGLANGVYQVVLQAKDSVHRRTIVRVR